ncbi:MAG: type I-E CRISPR-associated protein Cse1/CasA [Methylomonas sp.]|jgi:CRISPR system Cascade subunit CasA|uniref:type I-E CRISPR-associated protein Cse1/CasA n=1 Tax=Methylomonas sp. TaxID=418 RepID=UPI0025F84645|nr:type I-E CRISPR-associated protein Cse1/CasA [Methylomonas sp.]MCK9609136.1 type I-E CRISPR-associated protein Cse1/CasA [Methylomonas sp.]
MNLVTDPWLPVTNSKNQLCYISLNQLFEQPDEWLDLVLRPHERVSVMRFLICLVQAALDGPEEENDWDDAIEIIPEYTLEYLKHWRKNFYIFEDDIPESEENISPFLQIRSLKPGNDTTSGPSITKLDSSLAVGENASTLFDHGAACEITGYSIDREMTDSQIIISLITFLNYSPSGTQSSAKLGGVLIKHNSGATDSPCVNQNMLHTFVVKRSLVRTIHANLIDKETCEDFFGKNSWGKPVWEIAEPKSIDDEQAKQNAVVTYLGRLVPLSRFCKLKKESKYFVYCKGFEYSTKPKKKTDSKKVYRDFLPEPSTTIILSSENDYSVLKAGNNVPWREISALTAKRSKGTEGGALPLKFLSRGESLDIIVLGQIRDPENVAKVLDLVESKVHIPAFMLDSRNRQVYEANIKLCDQKSYQLFKAIEKYRASVDDDWKKILKRFSERETRPSDRKARDIFRKKATHYYWTLIEKQRHLLMQYISLLGTESDQAREESKKAWLNAINSAVDETYRTLCNQDSPRQLRAYVTGWQILHPSKSEHQEAA